MTNTLMLNSGSSISIDRPDSIKRGFKSALSFKEVKDCIFKFLMQSELSFTEGEKLSIPVEMRSKRTDDTILLQNSNYYTSTCRLNDIKIDNRNLYLLVVPTEYGRMESRQRNKIVALRCHYNIIIFDQADWEDVGLDISDKQWLKPLTRVMLRSLAKKLFEKIKELEGTITSKVTLNDVYKNIDTNTSTQSNQSSLINNLKDEVLGLKKRLRVYKIKENFKVSKNQENIVKELMLVSPLSVRWVEDTINNILNEVLRKIDLRQNLYKDLFRLKNGKVLVSNKDKLCEYITSILIKKRPNLDTQYLGNGFIEIQSKKTLQSLTLYMFPTTTEKIPVFEFSGEVIKKLKNRLVFTLVLNFLGTTSKVSRILGEIILLSHYEGTFKYSKEYRLRVFDSKVNNEYSLWTID